jgi:hypothetical protein
MLYPSIHSDNQPLTRSCPVRPIRSGVGFVESALAMRIFFGNLVV